MEAEVLKDFHRCLGGQHADIEHAGILDEVMGVVALVDRHGYLERVARDLDQSVHNATVVNVVIIGGQHIEAVADVE